MTRSDKNARSGIPASEASGRLRKAKAYRHAAHVLLQSLEEASLDRSPVVSNAILAVIAYTDAITIKAEGKINQKDHSTAPALLRSVLGRDLPDARFKDLQNLLSTKDEMQYGVKLTMQDTARDALSRLDTFGDWAKSWLEARGIA